MNPSFLALKFEACKSGSFAILSSSIFISPLVGFNKVPIIDKRVDFPLPLTPFSITHDEVFISIFISFNA